MVLAVLEPVDSEGILRPAARSALGDHISGVLGRIEGVSVIPSDQVRDLAAQKKTETYEGCYDQKCQIEIGMELAAQKLFILRISKLGQGCFAKAELLDLKKSASEWSGSVRGSCVEDELVHSFELLAEDFRLAQLGGQVSGAPKAKSEYAGRIKVTSEPAGATVTLDGREIGKTPLEREVSAEEHALGLRVDGYNDLSKLIVVRPKATVPIHERLVRQTGHLNITSTPSGATVEFNGRPLGMTPLKTDALPAGPARLRLALSGYEVWEDDVSVRGNAPTTMDVPLEPLKARLSILSVPSGTVRINDVEQGSTPLSIDVLPGTVEVEVSRPGFVAVQKRLSLAPAEQETVSFQLDERQVSAEERAENLRRILFWTSLSSGVAAGVVAVYFGVKAKSVDSSIETGGAGAAGLSESISEGKMFALVADVTGVAALALGAVAYALR